MNSAAEKQMKEIQRLLGHQAYTVKKKSMDAWNKLVADPSSDNAEALAGKLMQDGNKSAGMLVRLVRGLARTLSESEANVVDDQMSVVDVHRSGVLTQGIERILSLTKNLVGDLRHQDRHDEADQIEDVVRSLNNVAQTVSGRA